MEISPRAILEEFIFSLEFILCTPPLYDYDINAAVFQIPGTDVFFKLRFWYDSEVTLFHCNEKGLTFACAGSVDLLDPNSLRDLARMIRREADCFIPIKGLYGI